MGQVKANVAKVKLFFGLLAASEELLDAVRKRLEMDFSPLEVQSPPIAFVHTSYYEREMGANLLRQWVSTTAPMDMTDLVGIKLFTNELEMLWCEGEQRRVNIDPGYVGLAKVVLATTKDYDHRLYIGRGIYEEITLHYRRPQGFVAWPWTYPDYCTEEALRFFTEVRERLRQHR